MAKRRTAKKSAKKKAPARKAAKRQTPKRSLPKRSAAKTRAGARKPAISGLVVQIPPELDARLKMLATNMGKSMKDVVAQALAEFTETWEDHLRTVATLKEDEERVHLSVPKE